MKLPTPKDLSRLPHPAFLLQERIRGDDCLFAAGSDLAHAAVEQMLEERLAKIHCEGTEDHAFSSLKEAIAAIRAGRVTLTIGGE